MVVNNKLNILVVEDDDFQRQMIVRMLQSLNIPSISQAKNGKQALDFIREQQRNKADVVICDLFMPEMDGLEFLRHLGEEHHDISIIFISALGGKLLASAAKISKIYGVKLLGAIEKPIFPDELKDLISRHAQSENKWHSSAKKLDFSLDDILYGIEASQFEPFFQPKVSLKTRQLIGGEALARWIHPEFGEINPSAFIPLLEKSASIDKLTFLILKKAAVACRMFHDNGYEINVAVNLSLTSLSDTKLAEKITKIVKEAGIDPRYITLEITESAAMTGVAYALENLARLCMNGFVLSIDDYGTGYSSLQQLSRIACSELKIDQSFVQDISTNEASRIIIESSINMAHKLKVKSVAEGVETQQDWDMLSNMGCDIAQGYYIAKPMNVNSFLTFCATNVCKMSVVLGMTLLGAETHIYDVLNNLSAVPKV